MSEQLPIEGEFRSGSAGEKYEAFGDPYCEAAIHRLRPVVEAAGYWTPIGKLLESLVYAEMRDEAQRREVSRIAHLLLGGES